MILKYDPINHYWREETKEEVLQKEDIEGKNPCNFCWKDAKKNGVYSFPLKNHIRLKRCKCGRVMGTLGILDKLKRFFV